MTFFRKPRRPSRLDDGLRLLALCRQIAAYPSLDRVPARLLQELRRE